MDIIQLIIQYLPTAIQYFLAFALLITVVVFIHELGHYSVGRWCGIGVETFSIGMGKQIWGKTDKYGTLWRVAILPIGDKTTFIEIAQPTSGNTSAAHFLRDHGEGIYLTIYQIGDSLALDDSLSGEGVNFTTSRSTSNYTNMGFNSIWIHPKFMDGMFIQLSEVLSPENPWPPAGENWY